MYFGIGFSRMRKDFSHSEEENIVGLGTKDVAIVLPGIDVLYRSDLESSLT